MKSKRSSKVPSLEDGVAPDPYGLISGINDNSAGTGGHPIDRDECASMPVNTRRQPRINIENDSPLDNGAKILISRNK